MDILDDMKAAFKTGDKYFADRTPAGPIGQVLIALEKAISEIDRLRSIAGPVDSGPSAADVMEALRHMAQAGIDAEKMLAAVYEMDVRAFVEARRLVNAPQSGWVRAKMWD